MSISSIQSVLQQMRAVSLEGVAPKIGASPPAAGFAAELKSTLDKISGTQTAADRQAQAFELGTPGVSLNDVMVDLQKASVAFQTGLQVRNRLVAAYQEIMNLPA